MQRQQEFQLGGGSDGKGDEVVINLTSIRRDNLVPHRPPLTSSSSASSAPERHVSSAAATGSGAAAGTGGSGGEGHQNQPLHIQIAGFPTQVPDPAPPPRDRWLAADGSAYQTLVADLTVSDPRLRRRDPKAVARHIPWKDARVRLVLLESRDDDPVENGAAEKPLAGGAGAFGDPLEFTSAKSLEDYLSRPGTRRANGQSPMPSTEGPPGKGRRRVFILEGLSPSFISVLGEHFALDPSLFLEHERVVVMNRKGNGESDGIQLPSVVRERQRTGPGDRRGTGHITLQYFEPLIFNIPPDSFRFVCADTGRHIGVCWSEGDFTEVGIVRRKCTLWEWENEDGGWDCLILTDPAVRRIRNGVDYKEVIEVKTTPYQGGYVDFTPLSQQREWLARNPGKKPGPPRTSLLDDLVYYLRHRAAPSSGLVASSPSSPPRRVIYPLALRLVASHYLQHAEHTRAILSGVQRWLSRKQDPGKMRMTLVEELWSDVQGWERRTGEYIEALEAIMLQLGIPLREPDTSRSRRRRRRRGGSSQGGHAAKDAEASRRRGWEEDSASGSPSDGDGDVDDEDAYRDYGSGPASSLPLDEDSAWAADAALDFRHLHHRFRALRHRAEGLNHAVTGLANITGNRQAYREQQLMRDAARRSVREAKSAKSVTLLGLVFIPLAYTSSLFSMTEPYNPGESQFWLYWVTALPLILAVMVGYYILDIGYTEEADRWELGTFARNARDGWRRSSAWWTGKGPGPGTRQRSTWDVAEVKSL